MYRGYPLSSLRNSLGERYGTSRILGANRDKESKDELHILSSIFVYQVFHSTRGSIGGGWNSTLHKLFRAIPVD